MPNFRFIKTLVSDVEADFLVDAIKIYLDSVDDDDSLVDDVEATLQIFDEDGNLLYRDRKNIN